MSQPGPGPLKLLERAAKVALALLVSVLLWRPWRRSRAHEQLKTVRRVLLVRLDNRVGEALLLTPLVNALAKDARVEVLVHQKVARVLEGTPGIQHVRAFDRRALWLGPLAPGIRALRAERFEVVLNASNWSEVSVTGAVISRLISPRAALVGPSVWPGGALMDVAVAPRPDTQSEVEQRLHLLAPLNINSASAPLSFRTPRPSAQLASTLHKLESAKHAVLNPGGRLDWRRVPLEVFEHAGRALAANGRTCVVTWGPGEEVLAQELAGRIPGAWVAPATDLDELACVMRAAGVVVTNNTGPMHLAVALGVPTLAFFLHMPMARWAHQHPPHRALDLTSLDERARAEAVARETSALLGSLSR